MMFIKVILNAYLANVSEFTAVAAERYTTVFDKAGRSETPKVLLWALGPALGHLGATRLCRQLEGEDELALGVANEVNDGHVGSNLLLLGNQVNTKVVLAESSLDCGEVELVVERTSVGAETDAEGIQIFGPRGVDESGPCITSIHLGNAGPVDQTALITVQSLVPLLVAKLAFHGVGRAASSRMTLNSTCIAGTRERALNTLIRAVCLIVSNLATVVAFASKAAALRFIGALAGKVASLAAAVIEVSTLEYVTACIV
jgi:hypothetical protein